MALAVATVAAATMANRPAATPVSYDIELKFVGISGHHVRTAADCTDPVNPNGYDLLVGTVTGNETSATGEDVEYTGTLTRTTAMDFCDIKDTAPDQSVDCAATLIGAGTMAVSLRVYGEADRGAWLKATVTKTDSAKVSGNCDIREATEIRNAYRGAPQGAGGGGSPDGQPIEDRFSQPSPNRSVAGPGPLFFLGNQARLRVGFFPPDPAQGGWTLWVKQQHP
jgi:hypothetical protein